MLNSTTNEQEKTAKSGNKCGHNPETPRFFEPPPSHALRPPLLRAAILAVAKYFLSPFILPLLNAVNGSDRQQRSERREACIIVIGCILHYTDLATFRVGIPQADGSMAGLTMPFIAEKCGLSLRRTERAIHDLKKAGFINVYPIVKRLEGATYKGIAAIRTVSIHLFTVLGLDKWLIHERRKAAERKAKKENKQAKKNLANIQMAMNAQKGKAPKQQELPVTEGQRAEKMQSMKDIFAGLWAALDTG